MDLDAPYEAVAPSLHGAVLMVLRQAGQPLSGRAVAARAGASQEGARRVLLRLVEHGLATSSEAGNAVLYALNRDHVLADALEALAGARRALFDRMGQLVATWEPSPLSVTVYGSAARGDGDTSSDVDVLVVRADEPEGFSHWDRHLPELADAVQRWSGNDAEILEYSLGEVHEAARRHLPLLVAAAREGRHVYGRELRRLLADAQVVA